MNKILIAISPAAPSMDAKHYLGTDTIGRDILARLLYGFRIAMGFALLTMVISYAIGVTVGCVMGFGAVSSICSFNGLLKSGRWCRFCM